MDAGETAVMYGRELHFADSVLHEQSGIKAT